ncbi:MAG: hypothetical protein AAF348_03930 [Bacteroidota bacterium]
MELLQHFLMYLTLTAAVGYLLWKFVLPKSLVSGKRKTPKSCGQEDCGCN